MKFLVVGLGGIGQRHVRNIRAMYGNACEILAYRVRRQNAVLSDTLQIASAAGLEERYGIRSFDRLEDALAEQPTAALICNPSSMHLPVAIQAAEAGCHLLIEKPVSDCLAGTEKLQQLVAARGLVCMVAYQLRFHPCLTLARRLLADAAIGRPVACRATVGEYLPNWHTYEDYRTMYASQRALGGGVILSQIHEIDMLLWFFGRPRTVYSVGGQFSELEIDVEDVASTVLGYDRMAVHLHQDYLQNPPSRQLEIIGTAGQLKVDLRELTVSAHRRDATPICSERFADFQRNTLFEDELRTFVAACRGQGAVPVDLSAALESLEVAMAIRQSTETGQAIALALR